MIVDVKDASFGVFHGGRFCNWSILAYQHQPVYAIISRTSAHEIFIDGLGPQQSLLTLPSRIIKWRE